MNLMDIAGGFMENRAQAQRRYILRDKEKWWTISFFNMLFYQTVQDYDAGLLRPKPSGPSRSALVNIPENVRTGKILLVLIDSLRSLSFWSFESTSCRDKLDNRWESINWILQSLWGRLIARKSFNSLTCCGCCCGCWCGYCIFRLSRSVILTVLIWFI